MVDDGDEVNELGFSTFTSQKMSGANWVGGKR
jgi:hypothetical protein